MNDDDNIAEERAPLADAQAEVAAEAPVEPKEPLVERGYRDGSADVILRVGGVDEDDEADDEDVEPVQEALLHVPPPPKWPDMAYEYLHERRHTRWAELVLSEEDMASWRELAPEFGEAGAFLTRWAELSGQRAGKSRRSRQSLRAARGR